MVFFFKLYSRNIENTTSPVYSANGHSEIINCMDGVGGLGIGEGAPEIATGSRDGNVLTYITCTGLNFINDLFYTVHTLFGVFSTTKA